MIQMRLSFALSITEFKRRLATQTEKKLIKRNTDEPSTCGSPARSRQGSIVIFHSTPSKELHSESLNHLFLSLSPVVTSPTRGLGFGTNKRRRGRDFRENSSIFESEIFFKNEK